ncbi:hypothetical protein [Ornithobacterium rhinotracheale]|uniref:Glycosyl transferase family 1 n=1 Tax=Ornithobacterium rhinotracheale (strain ATCC 51463 / DSM 15997 / CCUG 23171 / CIP 104009 / LMG 9086) TaxID=867902 RepID=I3ZX14_ORNRL|nr:hypothetical protein [Ornithobacterium rhinotracheale]AFL96248.1 hypothetical protein Ornrh_0016 [Ornithobacterium rhinotracheale DSM 15997]AIP98487.1 glycosyl transferase family 1 [Ornithobacterium rhinotracheale ORT-UMN 88]KGB67928.1 hypothetical protein Q787_00085 [Ornithobacterium rhinotracheale H06-030791]MBN3663118.1 glycosyltransferase family 4 protein [Ornithobacterium rhinotracheale]MCK0193140.1 glycosyl transferase family 1 [Ornithobacterium rhinotracheale]
MQKVLLITYYWPPSGGAGVQRWLKMSKFLSKDCSLSVLVPQGAAYPILDETLQKDVAPNIEVITTPIWEPYALAQKINPKNKQYQKGQIEPSKKQSFLSKISLWIRANLFVPDARIFWKNSAVKECLKKLNLNDFDAIISTGPPHTCHLIALELKQKFPHLKWLADFRDPWTDIDYFGKLPLTRWALKKHKKLEKEVISKADIVTTVSPTWASDLAQIGGRNVEVVYNAYDEADFKSIDLIKLNKKLTVNYLGSLNHDRSPSVLWQLLDQKCQENEFCQQFNLNLIGNIASEVKEEILALKNLAQCTQFVPYLAHDEAIQEMCKSHVLLLLINDTENQKGIIPGKFFEYLATGREILCLGDPDSDLATLLHQTKAGKIFKRNDAKSLNHYLDDLYQKFKENQLDLRDNYASIQDFSRRKSAEKIMNLLNTKR